MEHLTIEDANRRFVGLAQFGRSFDHRVENGRKVSRRGIDDPKHLGGRGLLFQGLARLGDETCILHCDDGLSCKVLQERDLFVSKWPNFLADGGDPAKKDAILSERSVKGAGGI